MLRPFEPCLILAGCLIAGLAGATEFEPERLLALDAAAVETLKIDSGAGSLEIRGSSDSDRIEVRARVWIEDHPGRLDKASEVVDRHVELKLTADGNRAELIAMTRDPGRGYSLPHVDLIVTLPSRLDLDIRDRSGYVEIDDVSGDVKIRDDSGSINLDGVGGRVVIDDGSGSIALRDVTGPVRIDDGSGSIDVETVRADLYIDDGSGSINVREVDGSVTISDGSGSILVVGVSEDLTVTESGSGSVQFDAVAGDVSVD
ncbi:MAG: hypothetical protein OES37_05055 [Chromatiales bacterium]|jgi:hypothetical protein|nr:hypothetical protein [Chromatiales bacterium]